MRKIDDEEKKALVRIINAEGARRLVGNSIDQSSRVVHHNFSSERRKWRNTPLEGGTYKDMV